MVRRRNKMKKDIHTSDALLDDCSRDGFSQVGVVEIVTHVLKVIVWVTVVITTCVERE